MSIEKDLSRIAAALEQITLALKPKEGIIPISTEKTPEPEPVQETPHETTPVETIAESTPNVTHEELHDLCLSIVRKDRAKKNKIKAILKARNAELIKDVPEIDLSALKVELEAI